MQTIGKRQVDPGLFSALNFQSIEEAGLEMLYLSARSKLSEYQAEERHFENKYSMTFAEFRNNISKKVNEEDFDEENDFIAWQFSHENAAYWQKKVKELERCL